MRTLRTLTNQLNERINALSKEKLQLFLYCVCVMLSWKLDELHCKLLARYYSCSVEQLVSYERNGLLMVISILFGIVDFFFGYKILKLIYNLPPVQMDITKTNASLTSKDRVLKKVLKYPAASLLGIASISLASVSILCDIFYVISKFIF